MSILQCTPCPAVLIAEIKDTAPELGSTNCVLYRDAFTDFRSDIVCHYGISGVEQLVTLREAPPRPEELGLNAETTHLLAISEIVELRSDQKNGL